MTSSIDLRPEDLALVQAILKENLPEGTQAWVFGSRARGKARAASDLDVAIDAGRTLTLQERSDLTCAFEESDLPFTVDIVDMHTVGDGFRKIIEGQMVPLPVSP